MPTLAIVSFAGGVGRTMLAVHLATQAARDGHWSLALEWDMQNLMALHFGAVRPPADGIASCAARGQPWHGAALQSSDGVQVLPFGRLDDAQVCGWQARMEAEPGWLAAELGRLQRPADGWTFIDTPRAPDTLLRAAVHAADAVLLVVRADPGALAALDGLLALPGDKPHAVLVNGFDASRSLQADMQAALIERLGPRLAPHPLHRDEAVPAAFARQAALADVAPHAQVTHDLQGAWRWLRRRFQAEATADAQRG